MTPDRYETLAAPAEAAYKVKSSVFMGFAHPVGSHTPGDNHAGEHEVRDLLKGYRKKYYDATHVCHAYVLGAARTHTHAADDGEPAHSAGRPMLNVLLRSGLTQVAVFVVRYFGGSKLGVPGLIDAYGRAAAMALAAGRRTEKVITLRWQVTCVPEAENKVHILLKKEGAGIFYREAGDRVVITFAISQSLSQHLCNQLKSVPGAEVKLVG